MLAFAHSIFDWGRMVYLPFNIQVRQKRKFTVAVTLSS